MPAPIVLADDEIEALHVFFSHLYLPYDEKRQPIHRLLNRIEKYRSQT